jgi:hypothetical protein
MRKTCSKCGKSRRLKFFGKDVRYRLGVKGWCKDCEHAYASTPDARSKQGKRWQEWYSDPKNKAAYKDRRSKNRNTKEGKRSLKDAAYRRDYGITLEHFERKVKKQKSRCKLCGRKRRLCADHDHKNKKFRGAICWPCNTLIGHIELTPGLLKKLFRYLGGVL